MRRVIFAAACSLDGFIADAEGGMGWVQHSADSRAAMGEFWRNVDAVLLGRKAYEWIAPTGGRGSGRDGLSAYVFSRTLKSVDAPDAHLVDGEAGAFVRALKQQDGANVALLGGGELARALFEARVIDEIDLNIHPLLLGAGTPLFPGAGRIKLETIRAKPVAGGSILATYKVRY